MAMTLRDLSLPNRVESWRELRGLRVGAPGAAARDELRSATFQWALEQSQQLMEAAERAGYATRPLQLFYALSQGGRAIAAASPRLPATTTIPDRDEQGRLKNTNVPWKLRGHGITSARTDAGRIAEVVVQAKWTGLMPGVAQALGVACLTPGERVKVGDLWALLPESFSAALQSATALPALSFQGGDTPRQTSNGHDTAILGRVPNSVRASCGDDQIKLRAFLDHYPSLRGWTYPFGQGNPLGWEQYGSSPDFSLVPIYWPFPPESSPDYSATIQELKATRYRGEHDWWAFPRIGAMTQPLHPLLAWWAVLFALSIMARYEPSNWASMIRIDASSDANAIEHLLDQAVDVIPSILLEAICAAASEPHNPSTRDID